MHLPDGYLSNTLCTATTVAAGGSISFAAWQIRRGKHVDPRHMALAAAGVFAVQALNFPLATGVSGHLLGAVAATAILGPAAGVLVVAAVLALQCFAFGDGGVSALGANVLNMAVIGAVCGWPAWSLRRSGSTRAAATAAVAGGVAALVLGATACAAELHLSGTQPLGETLPILLPLHIALGAVEGLFAAALVVAFARRESLVESNPRGRSVGIGLAAIVLAAAALIPLASSRPDTLEAAAERLGFGEAASVLMQPLFNAATFESTGGAILFAIGGTLLAFAAVWISGRSLAREIYRRGNP